MSQRDQSLCLAALLQHCSLVDQLAHTGSVDHEELGFCLQQAFIFDHDSTEQAFGPPDGLLNGLELLASLLDRKADASKQIVLQYAVALVHLERKLSAQPDMLQIIRNRLEHASYRNSHFANDSHTVAENMAGIYQDTLSTLRYRIHVKGNMQHLQDDHIANSIRALLLCAVRAVRMWRLSGGSRLSLLLRRNAYAQAARELIDQLSN